MKDYYQERYSSERQAGVCDRSLSLRIFNILKGLAFGSMIFWTPMIGILFLPIYSLPTLLIRPDLYRELGDQIIGSALTFYTVRHIYN